MGLADALEADARVREAARCANGQITCWASPSLVSQPYVKNMVLNTRVLEITARHWCHTVSEPKLLPIKMLRKEAGL